jgi:hypothetical protein
MHAPGSSLYLVALLTSLAVVGAPPRGSGRAADSLALAPARAAYTAARFAAAESLARVALARAEKLHGRDSRQAADVIDVLAQSLNQEGGASAAPAQDLARRGLAIRERVLGPKHPDVASSLLVLTDILIEAGAYTTAQIRCASAH